MSLSINIVSKGIMYARLAPIVLFVYNRLWHIRQTIEALQKNEMAEDSVLFVFSDGPKSDADREKVIEVREYIRTLKGFKNVIIIERDQNFGLSKSIIEGVSEVVSRNGRIIVLEDDMVTSQYFLKFMNEGLEFYKDEERVVGIHAYMYPIAAELPETFFLRGADCWGWATWKRGWDFFEKNGKQMLKELYKQNLNIKFDLNRAYPYTAMLKNQIRGDNDSWAILWRASAFLRNRLYLQSGKSFIYNIGTDNTGIHCGTDAIFDTEIVKEPLIIRKIPVEENYFALKEIEKYLKSKRVTLISKILAKITMD